MTFESPDPLARPSPFDRMKTCFLLFKETDIVEDEDFSNFFDSPQQPIATVDFGNHDSLSPAFHE